MATLVLHGVLLALRTAIALLIVLMFAAQCAAAPPEAPGSALLNDLRGADGAGPCVEHVATKACEDALARGLIEWRRRAEETQIKLDAARAATVIVENETWEVIVWAAITGAVALGVGYGLGKLAD